jgi:hypothetical protein
VASEPGTLVVWNAADGVGRIRLDTGEELRVGQVALAYQRLEPGRRCEVLRTEPHPLGGRKAMQVKLLDETVDVAPRAAPAPDRTPWMRTRIATSIDGAVPNVEVQGLLDAYVTFSGGAIKPQLFGVDPAHVPRADWPALAELAKQALLQWKQRLTASGDAYLLDKAGRQLGIDFLKGPAPKLRCEPLGSLDGLTPDWVKLVKKLEASRGRRPNLKCLGLEGAGSAAWGVPDLQRLRETAIEWEATSEEMFPREIAALAAIADGLTVDDTPVIRPVSEWTDNDDGVELGCGSTFQGNLTLLPDGQVLDRDDDQVELHRFKSLGALLGALLD